MNENQKQGSAGYGVLGFCFPLVGLILYLVWKDEKPGDARYAGIGALIGVVASAVLFIISMMLGLLSTAQGF
jgi:hypothetical protein